MFSLSSLQLPSLRVSLFGERTMDKLEKMVIVRTLSDSSAVSTCSLSSSLCQSVSLGMQSDREEGGEESGVGSCSSPTGSHSADSMVSMGERDDVVRRLEEELRDARALLAERDARCSKLARLQSSVDEEVQELTEKLFQEAYKMVNVAEERREKAEKLLEESRLKVDVLCAEVSALKVLVKTPGAGANHHANTQKTSGGVSKFFNSSGKKTPSQLSPSSSFPAGKKAHSLPSTSGGGGGGVEEEQRRQDEVEEIDPLYYREFVSWREAGHPVVPSDVPSDGSAPADPAPFLARIEREDVETCMNFENLELSSRILSAIRQNSLELEPVSEEKPEVKQCALCGVPRFCPYRVRVDGGEWMQISLLARNRLAAVCDYFTYIRYLRLGIVKTGVKDSYFDVIALRKNMSLARLGLGFVPKSTASRPNQGFH